MTNTQFANIPDELKALNQFVTWIWPAPAKKLPCAVATGDVCDGTARDNWGSFSAAVAAAKEREHAGIGFALAEADPYVGIDLDDCVKDGRIIHADAQAIVDSIGGWWDISPSKTGLKTIVRGSVPGSATGKTPGGLKVEIYPAKRFFTLTGHSFEGRPTEIRTVNGELTKLYERLKPYVKQKLEAPRPLPLRTVDSDHARRYALAALEGEHQVMLAAGEGERHNTRRRAAYALAGYIPYLNPEEIFDALAVNFGADRKTAEKTIWDCIKAGRNEPREIPEKAQPSFDDDGHACCPTHHKRLVACRNGNGWRCPVISTSLCFWWQGEGYTPPAEVTLDDLDDLDADELRRRLRSAVAERDQWKRQAEHLDEWRSWALQIAALPTERVSPAAKVVALSLYPEIKSRESRGVNEPRRIYIGDPKKPDDDGFARRAGVSPGTYGAKLKELESVGALLRTKDRDPVTGFAKVLVQPVAFDTPTAWVPSEPRNHGGHHPKTSRPAPACPTHGDEAPVAEETTIVKQAVCVPCGKPLGEPSFTQKRVQVWPLEEPHTDAEVVEQAGPVEPTRNLPKQEEDSSAFSITQVAGWLPSDPPDSYNPQYRHFCPAPPLLDLTDPLSLPGVRSGQIAADDEWFKYHAAIAEQAVRAGGAS
ncbi:MAG: hypothetical protein AVDCRST_MAG93-4739 [uncultured Chloroflexia bacterium]|uniref:DNA primase/polymerase bifunctional N-terminal domain-containing protein n=1 Tax=uncultured Chloroflexia bacterium TaxID=1672391 RepID=A0A6J4KDT4_9CHLR|nr:MAG: hypothetical protein AVDCRST_MAG93-4739 [uncultured Chloroflexia bacterium]